MTERLSKVGRIIGIKLLDHIVEGMDESTTGQRGIISPYVDLLKVLIVEEGTIEEVVEWR